MQELINKVLQGDCLEVLKTFPDNYFDSLVTDPPCGINFMGKDFDKDKGGMLNWINWLSEIMNEAMRTMKPGALGLVWSIPRTSHWTGMALELAGFRLIDIVHHANGCLSEDTEIYVKTKGWVLFHECEVGDTVIGYNIEADRFSFQDVTQTYRFDYSDTAYRIESDSTDQVVSIGHRCIVEQNGTLTFREASTLEQQVSVPFLEGMPKLPNPIPDSQCNASDKEYNLFGGLCKATDKQCKQREESPIASLPRMQYEFRSKNKQHEAEILLKKLCEQCKKERHEDVGTSQKYCQQGSCGLDGQKQGILFSEYERREKSCMERGDNALQEKRKLQECSVCSMSQGILGNGSKGWVCDGTPSDNGSDRREMPVKDGSRPSYQPRSNGQRDRELDAFQEQQRTQVVRTRQSGCKTTLATVTPFHYEGVVWCVSVPDTAFVARRNGKIFVTGNSGFPKSQDIGKMLDAIAGVEREVIGVKVYGDGHIQNSSVSIGFHGCDPNDDRRNVTAPATPEAKHWDGWKTPALKPSIEGWWLIQKPISESSIARNILKHGVGGLNIEAGRIETNGEQPKGSGCRGGSSTWDRQDGGMFDAGRKYRGNITPITGRYPANLVLSCGANCNGESHSPDCPVTVIGDQSGISVSTGGKTTTGLKGLCYGNYEGESLGQNAGGLGDKGTAARYFKNLPFDTETIASIYYQAKASKRDRSCNGQVNNVHPTVKSRYLCEYFIKLITPPNGIVLDCFGGSGTTAIAAIENGFNYVLIEKEDEYFEIINQRIAATLKTVEPTLEERVQWLETQVQAQNSKIKKLELKNQQLSLFG